MRFRPILFAVLFLPAWLRAGTFDLSAAVSKADLELGETFTLSVVVAQDGNFTFSPQLEQPSFEGFQVQGGPRQGQQVNWVNGAVSARVTLQWELAPLKSGNLTLGPFKATAKDASVGEVSKTAPAIVIHVAKGQGMALPPTPTPDTGAANAASQELDELHDIKPDLGFPWARAGLLAVAAGSILGLILWYFFKPKKPRKIEVVRDPGQVALLDLEKAAALLRSGDEEGYYRELARIIR